MGGDRTKILCIKAKNLSEKNKYVKSVSVNGKRLKAPVLKHEDIKDGGVIVFEMVDKPATFGNK